MRRSKKIKISAPTDCDQDTGTVPVTNHWFRLSDEVILSIFRLLPQKDLLTLSLMSKKFRDLSRDDSLWTELTLDHADIKQTADSCRKLVERCKKLSSLKITNNANDPRSLNLMSVVIRAKDSLRSLEVDGSLDKWTDAAMAKLGMMKSLKLISFTFDTRYPQDPDGLFKLAELDQLEVLKIDIKTNLYEPLSEMSYVFQQLKQLKTVDLTSARGNMLFYLASNNPGLKVLKVDMYFDDADIEVLSDLCPDLEELKVDLYLDDFVPEKLSFPKLKYLDIELATYKLETDADDAVIKLIEKLWDLKKLNLRGFSIDLEEEEINESFFHRIRNHYPDINFTY